MGCVGRGRGDEAGCDGPESQKATFLYAKDFSKKLNLLVGHDAALSFDVGEDVAGHVAPNQLQLSHKLVLRPTALITKLCDVLANNIFVAVHTHLQALWAGLHGGTTGRPNVR